MKVFNIPITVKEANFYIDREVKRLLDIHVKVSNPEFEEELIKSSGIGWKQVKNYKNHPRPYQVINDNAKILEFVERSRNLDRWFKLKVLSLYSLILVIIAAPIGGIWFYLANQVPKTYIVKTNITNSQNLKFPKQFKFAPLLFKVPNSLIKLQLGPVQNSNINLSNFNCTELETIKSKNCQISIDEKSTIVLLLSNNVIYKISYTFGNDENIPEEVLNLKKQIEKNFKKTTSVENIYLTEKYENEIESVEVLSSKYPDGKLFHITVIDTLKQI